MSPVACRFVHAKLFHGTVEWFGKEIHHQHHMEQYYHISIDVRPAFQVSCSARLRLDRRTSPPRNTVVIELLAVT